MNWKAKGLIQRTLSVLPGGVSCNHFLQKNFGQLRSDSAITAAFNADVTVLFERMARVGADPAATRVLEIGTGWLPTFPLSLALAGFRNIYTVDILPHLREAAIRRTLMALKPCLDHPCFQYFATREQVHANYERMLRSENILAAANITYSAPCNAAATGWKPGSLDLITSNNVFEHIPAPILVELFAEAKRLLRPSGHVLHCVNCGDHYAYGDKNISQVNYLSFPESEWRHWNNSIQYQNRLRPIDFLEMAEDRGLRIESVELTTHPASLKQLETMVVAAEFEHYSKEQLAATSVTLIASA